MDNSNLSFICLQSACTRAPCCPGPKVYESNKSKALWHSATLWVALSAGVDTTFLSMFCAFPNWLFMIVRRLSLEEWWERAPLDLPKLCNIRTYLKYPFDLYPI